ncbi:MAG: putative rRNA maturation factor [Parcubacteria group bacterium GW2011_GWB1_40_14]|nr:MAG: putative rRNA maturation factor [Parcubacteria group bacterium GW2011_GWB1_40_14]
MKKKTIAAKSKKNTARKTRGNSKDISLTVRNVNRSALSKEFVKKIVDKTIFFANFRGSARHSVIFLDTREMKVIDRRYKPGLGHVSNVLTFNLSDSPVIADIFICVPQAGKEAGMYGLDSRSYISFLIIHGILHSIGFAHEHSAAKRRKMETLEEKILFSLFLNK